MPRRNHPRPAPGRTARFERWWTPSDLPDHKLYEAYARELVRAGLASSLILDGPRHNTTEGAGQ